MANQFQPGMVVQLKSGGPLMTISNYSQSQQQFVCQWFLEGEVKSAFFNPTSIKEVSENN